MAIGLLILIGFGYFLANAADQYQIVARLNGAEVGKVASGYQLAMEVMLINRIGAAFYFLATALFIESGGNLSHYVFSIGVALILVTSVNIYLLYPILKGMRVSDNQAPSMFSSMTIFSAVAFVFGHAGLTVPYIAGFMIPDYRLTLANSSFLLTSIFTLLTTLVIDRKLSREIDDNSGRLRELVYSVIIGRIFCGILLIIPLGIFSV